MLLYAQLAGPLYSLNSFGQSFESLATLDGVRVSGVSGSAIDLYETQAVTIAGALLHDWGGSHGVWARYSSVDADRCTVVAPPASVAFRLVTSTNNWLSLSDLELTNLAVSAAGASALHATTSTGVVIRDSILVASGSGVPVVDISGIDTLAGSDLNDLYASDGAVIGTVAGFEAPLLADFQALSYTDAHSISVEPLYADPTAADLHLASQEGRWDPATETWVQDATTSACVDAGDPTRAVDDESAPNGGVVNLGAYGGTAEASRSPASGRWLTLLGTGCAGEPLHGVEPVRWSARGSAWSPTETVSLEVSQSSGSSWQPMVGGSAVRAADGIVWWDTRTVGDGSLYRLRVVSDAPPVVSAASMQDLTVLNGEVPLGDVNGDASLDAGDLMAVVQRESDPGMALEGDPYCLSNEGLDVLWCVLDRVWLVW